MKWHEEIPKDDGWYWLKSGSDGAMRIDLISRGRVWDDTYEEYRTLEEWEFEYWGPLEEPE